MKKVRLFGLIALALLWGALTCAAWFGPAENFSDTMLSNTELANVQFLKAAE